MGHSYSRLIVLMSLVGCPQSAGAPADPPSPTKLASAGTAPLPPPTPGPAPSGGAVEVRLLGKRPTAFQVVVSGDAIDLSRDVTIEHEADSGRYPIGGIIQLIESCDKQLDAGTCVSLPAKGTITPVPWTGFTCDSQCPRACRANAYLGPGVFRYVVKSCDGKRQWASPYFTLPPYK